jgi:tRNA pseudouridine55 synthase
MAYSASNSSGFVTVPSGLIAVYKPKEWSSSDVVGKVRNILRNGAKEAANKKTGKVNIKVGHGGTLDPLAEGVLVLGIGEGTKLLQQYVFCSRVFLLFLFLTSVSLSIYYCLHVCIL